MRTKVPGGYLESNARVIVLLPAPGDELGSVSHGNERQRIPATPHIINTTCLGSASFRVRCGARAAATSSGFTAVTRWDAIIGTMDQAVEAEARDTDALLRNLLVLVSQRL